MATQLHSLTEEVSSINLGSLIRYRRINLGLSLSTLSQELGISNSLLSLIEANQRIPNLKLLFEICDKLGLLPHELLLKAHLDKLNKITEGCWENDFGRIRKSIEFIDKKFLHPKEVDVLVTEDERESILSS